MKASAKCINVKVRGHLPLILYTHTTGSHRRGMKEPHAAREPWTADPWPRPRDSVYTHTQREIMLWVGLQTTANTIPALCSERRETRLNYYLKFHTSSLFCSICKISIYKCPLLKWRSHLTSHLLLDLQWRAFGITVLKNGCNDEDKNDSLSVKNPL